MRRFFLPLFIAVLTLAEGSRASAVVWKNETVDGIEYIYASTVSRQAVTRAQYIVKPMLTNLPDVRKKMVDRHFEVEIIARDQVLSDLPDYADLKGQRTKVGNRDFDTGTRGLGGGDKCSIGEENLLCLPKQNYPGQDVLIHEFSHSVMANLGPALVREIEAAYQQATAENLYPRSEYIMQTSSEYWACSTTAWFNGLAFKRANGGFHDHARMTAHDPRLAETFARVYGKVEIEHPLNCIY